MNKEQNKIVEMCKAAYIKVMGEAKWNRLNDQQKHDAIMAMVRMTLRAA